MTPPPSPAPKAPGWEILGRLGSGSMGVVWKARRADGTLAALKVAKPFAKLSQSEAGSHFRRESLACLNLDHPNLVRGLDAGVTEDGCPYLALEFVEGRTLHAEVQEKGALDEARVVAVGAALAKALAHAHRLGLVHRDVKPRNVMLEARGGVKLLDLGLVEETTEAGGRHAFGTFGFVAPEILAGEKPGPRADLFSLGATLAAAATGEMPTKDRDFADRALAATARGRPLSPGLRAVLERLVKRDPAARYASAAELVLDFDALAAGERPLGAILGAGAARAVRRGPRVAAVAAAVALGAAGVWWIATRPSVQVDRPPPAAAPTPTPSPAPSPVEKRDEKLDAARVFLERFPDDFVRGRELLAAVDEKSLSPSQRDELVALREALGSRAEAVVEALWSQVEKRSSAAAAERDYLGAHDIVAAAQHRLRLTARGTEAADLRMRQFLGQAQGESALLVANTATAVQAIDTGLGRAAENAQDLRTRLDVALARRAFEGDLRPEVESARTELLAALERAARRESQSRSAVDQKAQLTSALASHAMHPSPEHFRAVLDAANLDAVPAPLREDSRKVAEAWERAEPVVATRVADLQRQQWCGPRGSTLFVGLVEEAPSADDVFLASLWSIAHGRVEPLAAVAGGSEEAAAWLAARGRFDEAAEASGPSGAATLLLAGAPRPSPPLLTMPPLPGFDAPLALREPGTIVEAVVRGDRAVDTWSAAIRSKARPAAVPAAKNPAKIAGRDAFLKDDLASAAASLADAMNVDPWDAEVAALRGRVFLVGTRSLPTAPALILAFAEGRRAWDLDPKMPAGPVLAAEAGIELMAVASRELVRIVRPSVVAACDAAAAFGREDGRMLALSAEWRLESGRAAEAVTLLRRAVVKSPGSGEIALSLARAEHAAGHDDKAKAALGRARELLGGELPASAADLVRALGE